MKKSAENDLWRWFSRFIRLRDAEPFTGMAACFTCGRLRHWKEMDCGHGIPRQHKATKYSEVNNHAQCKRCNAFEGGRMDEYSRQVDKRYGNGTWDKLLLAARQPCKRSRVDIEMMAAHYKREAVKLAEMKKISI